MRGSFAVFGHFRKPQGRAAQARRACAALLVMTLGVLGAELAAEWLCRAVAYRRDYWAEDAAVQFEYYRRLVRHGHAPDVVIIGDSTAARGLDPEALRDGLPAGTEVYSLAYPANFPLALRYSTLPLLQAPHAAPRLVVACLSAHSFVETQQARDLEDQILASPVCLRRCHPWMLSNHLVLPHLLRLWPLRRQSQVRLTAPLDHGFHPLDGHADGVPARGIAGESSASEAYRAWVTPAAAVRAPSVGQPRCLAPDRLEVLRELGQLARKRGFTLVVLVPPTQLVYSHGRKAAHVAELVDEAARVGDEQDFRVLDWDDVPFLGPEDFWDCGHLNRHGARKASAELAALLTPLLPQKQR